MEIVRRAHEALNAGNLDELLTVCHPDFQLDMSDRVLNPATYQGHDGIRQFHSEVQGRLGAPGPSGDHDGRSPARAPKTAGVSVSAATYLGVTSGCRSAS